MDTAAATDRRVLAPAGLDRLIGALQADGYETLGPAVRDHVVRLAPIDGLADLPRSVGDDTSPGRYRLTDRNDGAYFGFAAPADSWKPHLFPPSQVLFTAVATDSGIRFEPAEPPARKRAFVGVRGCDLAAIAILDAVMLQQDHPDPHYAARRDGLFLIAADCSSPAPTCFCSSMGTGPAAGPGADLTLAELDPGTPDHRFLVTVGTAAGAELLNGLATYDATVADVQTAEALARHAEAAMQRSMQPGAWQPDPEDPRWTDVAKRCLSCANCTMACPTCFCFDMGEETDAVTGTMQRARTWGSCFERSHSYLHGGAVHSSPKSRYRQWLTHKLITWPEQFGTAGCVGCGRCIAWCPVGIDITEEAAALEEPPMTAIDDVLTAHPFFTGLDPDLLQRFTTCSRPVEFATDATILQAGAPAHCMYAITKGRVAVGVRVPGRGLQVIETLQAGDILGWSWLFEPYVWTFDAVAVKPVRAIEVGTACIRQVLDADPAAAAVIYRSVGALMAERLASARLRLVDLFGEGH